MSRFSKIAIINEKEEHDTSELYKWKKGKSKLSHFQNDEDDVLSSNQSSDYDSSCILIDDDISNFQQSSDDDSSFNQNNDISGSNKKKGDIKCRNVQAQEILLDDSMFNNQYYELDETSNATFDDEDVKKLIKERDSYLKNKKKLKMSITDYWKMPQMSQ